MSAQLPGTVLARAGTILAEESAELIARSPKSVAWSAVAATHMPDGVPMAWMRALYRHQPLVAAEGSGSKFTDLDGHTYVDFNVADLSMAAGFAPPAIVEAITAQAQRGNHFLLPTTDAVAVCELLTDRFGLPKWQFTLSASGANADALRVARVATGRSTVLLFDGKYHGHLDQTMWAREHDELVPELLGLDPTSGAHVDEIPYNDVAALRQRLAVGDVAAVLVEPVLTNCGLVLPRPGFVAALNDEVSASGAVLIVDETHAQFACFGGGTASFGYQPDMITGGKGIGGGVPIGVFGMTDELAAVMAANLAHDPGVHEAGDTTGVATGGTLYANALSMAAARAGLAHVFTRDASERVATLGARLQDGLQQQVDRVGLPWVIDRFGGRVQWRLTAEAPRTGADGYASVVVVLSDARKVFMANRGVWDAIGTAGPSVSYAADASDVDLYVSVAGEFLDALVA